MHVECLFDFKPHRICPRLGPKNADIKAACARINPRFVEALKDVEHIGRRDHDPLWLKICDEAHLLFGLPATHGNHCRPKPLDPVMRAKTTGEKAVAIGVVHCVATLEARSAQRAGDDVCPDIDIVLGINYDRGFAGCAGGGMNAHQLFARHGSKAKRIIRPQVVFICEGEFRQIAQARQIIRVHPSSIKALLIHWHIVIGVLQRGLHPRQLQRHNLVA